MARPPLSIPVKPKDLALIEELVRSGVQQVRVVWRALALRHLARGATAPRVAEGLPLETQFAERKVEPNSGLGKAITYLLRHWKALTLFLRQAGAPLDIIFAKGH